MNEFVNGDSSDLNRMLGTWKKYPFGSERAIGYNSIQSGRIGHKASC